jgi:two-component system LytT family response regulator
MKKYNVLIIDDDLLNVNILKFYLKKHFAMIDMIAEASNVHEGIQEFKRQQPDILLLDIELGNDTIFSFLDAINQIPREVIFISSHKHFGVKAVNYDIASYVLKPINIEDLKKAIFKAIFKLDQEQKDVILVSAQKNETDRGETSNINAGPVLKKLS